MSSTEMVLIDRLLTVIEKEILPLTQSGVAAGNKVFGAALLHKNDYSTLLAETNNEMESPLMHGEMHVLKRYYEIPVDERPDPKSLVFLTTHEPCSLCLSAITWGGFDNFYYLFTHEDSRDAFSIPHDLDILKEVFDIEPGGYRRKNAYWNSFSIKELVLMQPEKEATRLHSRIDDLIALYNSASDTYQDSKTQSTIPLK